MLVQESKYVLTIIKAFAIFLLVTSIVQCNPSKQKPVEEKSLLNEKEENSDLAAKLYTHYVANPKTRSETEQNRIIEYCVAQSLNMDRTQSGLYYLIEKEGQGPKLTNKETITADYQGALLDGKVFDSSFRRKKPLVFRINQMIPGWKEGLPLLQHGSHAKFIIPSIMAYGEEGFPSFVGPNEVLVFDIRVH